MTEFNDGDMVVGNYGTKWTRRGGVWTVNNEGMTFSDNTMEWLLDLDVKIPKPVVESGGKISKSVIEPPAPFQYKFTLKRSNV